MTNALEQKGRSNIEQDAASGIYQLQPSAQGNGGLHGYKLVLLQLQTYETLLGSITSVVSIVERPLDHDIHRSIQEGLTT